MFLSGGILPYKLAISGNSTGQLNLEFLVKNLNYKIFVEILWHTDFSPPVRLHYRIWENAPQRSASETGESLTKHFSWH